MCSWFQFFLFINIFLGSVDTIPSAPSLGDHKLFAQKKTTQTESGSWVSLASASHRHSTSSSRSTGSAGVCTLVASQSRPCPSSSYSCRISRKTRVGCAASVANSGTRMPIIATYLGLHGKIAWSTHPRRRRATPDRRQGDHIGLHRIQDPWGTTHREPRVQDRLRVRQPSRMSISPNRKKERGTGRARRELRQAGPQEPLAPPHPRPIEGPATTMDEHASSYWSLCQQFNDYHLPGRAEAERCDSLLKKADPDSLRRPFTQQWTSFPRPEKRWTQLSWPEATLCLSGEPSSLCHWNGFASTPTTSRLKSEDRLQHKGRRGNGHLGRRERDEGCEYQRISNEDPGRLHAHAGKPSTTVSTGTHCRRGEESKETKGRKTGRRSIQCRGNCKRHAGASAFFGGPGHGCATATMTEGLPRRLFFCMHLMK